MTSKSAEATTATVAVAVVVPRNAQQIADDSFEVAKKDSISGQVSCLVINLLARLAGWMALYRARFKQLHVSKTWSSASAFCCAREPRMLHRPKCT